MAALLLNIQTGDEVILPSYTFVSTANAFVLRGATPVFIDIRSDTLNIDEKLIESAITPKTKAIIPVHYAGVACEMDSIMDIANSYGLAVVEDAAQAVMSSYSGRPLGGIGDLGAYSFHETKNVISGEGGALLVNDDKLALRAEIIREKGTDRSQFFRGMIDKYTWQEIGSSYLPGEVIAAFLWAQLEHAESITKSRLDIWKNYHDLLGGLELKGAIRRPIVPVDCLHNAHMYYILLEKGRDRQKVLSHLQSRGIGAVFHYVPLHSSPAGARFGRVSGSMNVVENASNQIIRLPLWVGLSLEEQIQVVNTLQEVLDQ
jgi:dTDP-4-amino-4,6-dideoxygalactose transaminase